MWHGTERLGASFFFTRGEGDLSNASKFFTTLARDLAIRLASSQPAISASIQRAIERNPDISQEGLREQWKNLILHPLSHLDGASRLSGPILYMLVVDALDECDGDDDIRLILQLLSKPMFSDASNCGYS
jgi:hypothetical protein